MDIVIVMNENEFVGKGIITKVDVQAIGTCPRRFWHILLTEGPYKDNVAISSDPLEVDVFDTTCVVSLEKYKIMYKHLGV